MTIDEIEQTKGCMDFKQHEEAHDEDIAVKSIATAFQFGMALGFAKKYDEMDKVMEEVKKAITQDQQPCEDAVSREVYKHVIRERDIAIEQLNELGYEFGEKIEQEPLEVEATKLQKAYNKGFEDCRQAALDIYDDYNVAVENGELEAYRKHRNRLLKLPSPQPKTGQWIDDKCSECGKGIEDLIASPEWYRDEEPNFCPFCGIKLVDEQESENCNQFSQG